MLSNTEKAASVFRPKHQAVQVLINTVQGCLIVYANCCNLAVRYIRLPADADGIPTVCTRICHAAPLAGQAKSHQPAFGNR